MKIVPITLREAREFVEKHHRHNGPPTGYKFGVGLVDDERRLIGVATAGRSIAAAFNNRFIIEVNRTCTFGDRNANSMLYGAIRRAAVAMGYLRIYTYTQQTESGASLRAAGFRKDKDLPPRANWYDSAFRARKLSTPTSTTSAPRTRWVWP